MRLHKSWFASQIISQAGMKHLAGTVLEFHVAEIAGPQPRGLKRPAGVPEEIP